MDDATRKDLILFLKEFCSFSQTLAQQNREGFFKVSIYFLRSSFFIGAHGAAE